MIDVDNITMIAIITIIPLYLLHREAQTTSRRRSERQLCERIKMITTIAIAVIAVMTITAEVILC